MQLLALDASDDLVHAVLTTTLARDLENGAFWRTLWMKEPPEDPSAPPVMWQLMELTNGAQLRTEGCPASLRRQLCRPLLARGVPVWSLRVCRGEKVRHVLTIEVDMTRRAVIQARGWRNRAPSGKPLRLLQEWADRERVRPMI